MTRPAEPGPDLTAVIRWARCAIFDSHEARLFQRYDWRLQRPVPVGLRCAHCRRPLPISPTSVALAR